MATLFDGGRSSYAQGVQQRLGVTSTGYTKKTLDGINPNPPPVDTWNNITENKAREVLAADKNKTKQTQDKKQNSEIPFDYRKPAGPASAPAVAKKQREVYQRNYPSDLPMGEGSYYLQIMLGPYDENVALNSGSVQHDMSIALPIPSNLLSSTSLDYSNINLGAFGGEFLKSALRLGNAVDNGNLIGQLRYEVNTGIRAVLDRNDSSVRQLIARRALSSLSPTLGSAIDLASGTTPNPHVAVTFNNVKLRSFTYTWRFSPNSAAESAALREIIKKLHNRVLPEKSGNLLLRYPNQCMLRMFPTPLNELFQFKPCVVDSMNVNYAPNGVPSFFASTQLPTEIELSMTFHEIQLRTAEDYRGS